jgi:predicted nucleotidyltransferase
MSYGLEDITLQKIKSVFSNFPQIEQAILYGSRAKGNFRPGSDIDITLKGDGLTLAVMNEIGLRLDDLLLPYFIDLSVYSHIKEADLLEHIERVGIEVYHGED